jgi:intraflagellar transport protein 80
VDNKTHVDTVIAYRQRNLQMSGGRQENNERFLQYSQGLEIDWETIKSKIRADKDREEEMNK